MIGVHHKGEYPNTVTNNGEESYDVRRMCLSCDYIARWMGTHPWLFNAKTGTMHLQGQDEFTMCGRVATEEHWLWQL